MVWINYWNDLHGNVLIQCDMIRAVVIATTGLESFRV